MRDIFNDSKRIYEISHTIISLIPKMEVATLIKEFRTISLCNVVYKVVTKILANKLKDIMNELVAPNQCSFVQGRNGFDNVIVAQEVIHTMSSLRGKKGFFAIKIDLEKAYDRVKWSFMEHILKEFSVASKFVDLDMKCISSTSMQLLWNRDKTESFRPLRGLRQGDPLSPYLFVLVMERLSQLIYEKMKSKEWKPIKLGRRGPAISHLFLADDLLLFGEALMELGLFRKCWKNSIQCRAKG